MPTIDRYRATMLLLGVTVLFIANPIGHAASHVIFDHPFETQGDATEGNWSAEAHCHLCNAVTPLAPVLPSTSTPAPTYLSGSTSITKEAFLAPDLKHTIRLRAPPFQA